MSTALQLYSPGDVVGRALRLNPFRGRVMDFIGGWTVLPRIQPVETDDRARRTIRRVRRTRSPLWPKSAPEAFEDRVARIARAFRNIGDLLG